MKRFHEKYEVKDAGYVTPCWIWKAGIDSWGYGRFRYKGRTALAHRVSWELLKGELPVYPARELDHLCRNPACVNPAHLEAVKQKENVMRGSSFSAVNSAKQFCSNGHEFTDENTYMRPSGNRDCRQCIRDRSQKYRDKQGSAA
ncbi:HNH endonuclease signature motif containing protein [Azotobacter vinelandii]|uniref:HNH endonuclease signature motif containing protein n=1 Tax=Azotobacter vinelandii TaxID=354 RepID=UPI0009318975